MSAVDLAGFAGLPIIRDEAMLRRAWVGYDVAGRMVVYALAGHEPRYVSEEPVATIRMGVDIYEAFAAQMKQGPPAPGDMYKRALAKAEARVRKSQTIIRFEEMVNEMLADLTDEQLGGGVR